MISQDLPPDLEFWELLAVNVYRETFRFFAPITSAATENYRQNLSHASLLPVSRAPRPWPRSSTTSSQPKTTGKTSPTRHFCRYPARLVPGREAHRAAALNSKIPAPPRTLTFAGIPRAIHYPNPIHSPAITTSDMIKISTTQTADAHNR